jgi:hypothetical protein
MDVLPTLGPVDACIGVGTVTYSFDTAWAPPIEGYIHISRLFPGLRFTMTYYEPGMCFAGCAIIEDGEVIASSEASDGAEADIPFPNYDWETGEGTDGYDLMDELREIAWIPTT